MKKYTFRTATQLRARTLTRATVPKPFPGKYPTRIAWSVALPNGKTETYIGKPVNKATKRFYSLLAANMPLRHKSWAIEFDRQGIIAKYRGADMGVANAGVRAIYHPITEERRYFFAKPFRWMPADAMPEPEPVPPPTATAPPMPGPTAEEQPIPTAYYQGFWGNPGQWQVIDEFTAPTPTPNRRRIVCYPITTPTEGAATRNANR